MSSFPSERSRLGERLGYLRRRAVLLQIIRRFFDRRGFVEIEAPILVPSPGLELHLDAFSVADPQGGARYLITSPEYQMKRLLAGGFDKIYSLGKVFRRRELGRHHNPEFTMLEWYRAEAGWEAIATDMEELVAEATRELCGATKVGPIAVDPPWERVSVRELMERYAGVLVEGDEPVATLRERAERAGHRLPAEGDYSDLFFSVFLDAVEPRLPPDRPILVYDWPRPLGALARHKPTDPRVVERFEVYAGGLELCNAFGELTDPAEQRARCLQDLEERRRRGLPLYPLDERFLAALGDMPPSAGIALGVDRLAMLLLQVDDIRSILPFQADEL